MALEQIFNDNGVSWLASDKSKVPITSMTHLGSEELDICPNEDTESRISEAAPEGANAYGHISGHRSYCKEHDSPAVRFYVNYFRV